MINDILELKNYSSFPIEQYEKLMVQMPLFKLKDEQLKMYIQKMIMNGIVYVLEENGNLLGLEGFYANNYISYNAYLSALVIDHSLSRKGYGSVFVKKMLYTCKVKGMKTISLNVVKENHSAIAFYSHFGFSISSLQGRDDNHMIMTCLIK